MKTVILHLEPHDDIHSVADRLVWVKAPRALLLWPEEGCGLERRLDFVLLARRAQALGLRVAIVSSSRSVRRLAEQAGLPAFVSRREALQRPWLRRRRPRPRYRPVRDWIALRQAVQALAPRPLSPWARLAAFTAAVLAILALATFTLPAAEITLQPVRHEQSLRLSLWLSPAYATTTLGGQVPARWLEVTVSGTLTRETTGQTRLPERPAYAALRFTNLTDQPVEVPTETRVRSRTAPEHVFVTTEAVTVPPLGQATVLARDLLPGSQGNRPADDLQVLEGDLALRLTVTNPQPASGGTDRTVPAPSPVDYAVLQTRLAQRLSQQAQAQLLSLAGEDWLLLDTLERRATLEAAFSAQAGEPAKTLTLTLRQTYRALLVERRTVADLALRLLDARLEPGWVPVPDSLVLTPQGAPQPDPTEQNRYRWTVLARRWIQPQVNGEALAAGVAGRTPAAAQAWLAQQVPLAAAPQVRLRPAWWPRLPWLPYRIVVTVALSP